jgi:hypothetical protein
MTCDCPPDVNGPACERLATAVPTAYPVDLPVTPKMQERMQAAGWRPPVRVITTVEELDAVPLGTVLRMVNPLTTMNNYGQHMVAEMDGDEDPGYERRGLNFMGWDYSILPHDSDILPATVLWEPTT